MVQTISFRRRNLPHWRVAGRSYFVTFRLHGTIPADIVTELKERRKEIIKNGSEKEIIENQRYEFLKIEKILDVNHSSQNHLMNRQIAGIVLDYFAEVEVKFGWRFPAIVVMPNHVHCLCCGESATDNLDVMLRKLKGYTAFKANEILERRGKPFWASESFDHWCRNFQKEESVKKYIRNNPVKAGLVAKAEDWPWLVEKGNLLQ